MATIENLSSDENLIPILYHDKNFLIVSKPPDMRIDGDASQYPTVHSQLQQRFPEYHLRNVHRLDYATSGVFCLALTRSAAGAATKLFENRHVKKEYIAIVRGHVPKDITEISAFIAPHPTDPVIMHVPQDLTVLPTTGSLAPRAASTLVRVVHHGYFNASSTTTNANSTPERIPATLVSLQPITGRRHQLRVHLKSIGHPILGDYTYESDYQRGGPGYTDAPRMMLHAKSLVLPLTKVKGWNDVPRIEVDAGDCIADFLEIF